MSRIPLLLALLSVAGLVVLFLPAPCPAQHYFLVTAYLRQARWDKALEVMERIPDLPPALRLQKGICLAELDRGPEALAVLREVAASQKGNPWGRQARAKIVEILEAGEDHHALIEFLRSSLKEGSEGPWRRLLARSLARIGEVDEAVETLGWTVREDEVALLIRILAPRKAGGALFEKRRAELGDSLDLVRRRHLVLLAEGLERWADGAALLAPLVAAGAATVEDLDRLADLQGRLGRLADVVKTLERRLAASKTGRGAVIERLGRALMAAGRADEARTRLRGLVDEGENGEEGCRWAARALVEHGFVDEARAVLLEGRSRLKRKDAFHVELAELAERARNWPVFVDELLLGAVGSKETRRSTVERLVEACRMRPEAAAAVEARLEAVLERFPTIEAYWFVLHGFLVGRGAGAEAMGAFVERMVGALDPDGDQLQEWAAAFELDGRSLEASLLLERASRKSPAAARGEILLRLARSLRRQGLAARAMETLDRALREALAPRQIEDVQDERAALFLDALGRPDRAEDLLRRLLKERGESERREDWRLRLARALVHRGEFEAAEAELAANRPEDESLRAAHELLMARVALLRGRLAEGRKRLMTVAEDRPASPEANDALRRSLVLASLSALEKTSDADLLRWIGLREMMDTGRFAAYETAVAAWPPAEVPPSLATEMLDLEARNAARKGNWTQAVASWTKLLELDPDWHGATEAWLETARIQEEELGRPDEARGSLAAFLKKHPFTTRLEEIRLRMERLARSATPSGAR